MYQHGWYTTLKKTAKWQEVRKIAPIWAINFDVAKIHKVIDEKNTLISNDKRKIVDDTYMICKDIDGNMWAESKRNFRMRYERTNETDGYWRKFTPTADAVNLAKVTRSGDIVQMKSLDKKNKWNLTIEEFRGNYVPSH